MTIDSTPEALQDLWQSQRSASSSVAVEDLRRATDRLTRKVFWRNLSEYVAVVIVLVGFGRTLLQEHTWMLRLGCGLVMAAAIFAALQFRRKGTSARRGDGTDARSCTDYYRTELVRQYELLTSAWKWFVLPFVPGLALTLGGCLQLALRRPEVHLSTIVWMFGGTALACVVTLAGIAWLNLWSAKKLKQRIAELDAMRG